MKKGIPLLYVSKEECCGCSACYAICPRKAITMVEDKEAFEYPVIDKEKCVRCIKCVNVCPIKKSGKKNLKRIQKRNKHGKICL